MGPIFYVSRLLALAGCLLPALPLLAQQAPPRPARAIYTHVSQPPHLPGSTSEADLVSALQKEVIYPPRAKQQGIAGKVFVKLTIDPEGAISEADIARSLRPDCDSAALAAVRRLPRLVPATQNGRAVYYRFSVPVSFPPPTTATKP